MIDVEGSNSKAWEDSGGSVVFARIPPRVGLVTARGRPGEGCVAAWKEHFPWLIVEQVSLFIDMSLLESWPGRVTHVSTSMTIELAPAYAEFNVLVSDPIRGMIARTVGLSIGERLTVYREREKFEARLIQVLEAQREPMPHPLV